MTLFWIVAAFVGIVVFIVSRNLARSRRGAKGEMAATGDMLYALPTICDPYPPLAEASHPPRPGEFVLHEDDWRQVEFVSGDNRAYIGQQFGRHQAFRAEKRSGGGYTATLARPEHPVPFSALGLSRAALGDALGVTSWHPLSIRWLGGAKEVIGGFSFPLTDGLVLYGCDPEGQVRNAGLLVSRHDPSASVPDNLSRLARLGNIDLVDWYSLALVPLSDASKLSTWWRGYGARTI